MITVTFTEQEVQAMLEFMQRANLKGTEAFAFTALVNKIVGAANARNQKPEKEDADAE